MPLAHTLRISHYVMVLGDERLSNPQPADRFLRRASVTKGSKDILNNVEYYIFFWQVKLEIELSAHKMLAGTVHLPSLDLDQQQGANWDEVHRLTRKVLSASLDEGVMFPIMERMEYGSEYTQLNTLTVGAQRAGFRWRSPF